MKTFVHVKYLAGQQELRRFLDSSEETKERVPTMVHPHCAEAECSCAKAVALYRGKKVVVLDIPYSSRLRVMEVK